MAAVNAISPHLQGVDAPAALRNVPAWLMWRFEYTPGVEKPRKVPYWVNGQKRHGTQGSPLDVGNLTTFAAAKRAAAKRGFDGVGFATLRQFGIVALDFDNCVTDGQVDSRIESMLLDTYAEYSPSHRGVRAFFVGELADGKDLRGDDFDVEVFHEKGFVTFTGDPLEVVELMGNTDTVAPLTETVRELHRRRFSRPVEPVDVSSSFEPVGMSEEEIRKVILTLNPGMPHKEWLAVGMAIHHETAGQGFDLWDQWSKLDTDKYPGVDELRKRWRSFGKRDDKIVTMRSVMKMAGISLNAPASPEEFDALVESAAPTEQSAEPTAESKAPRYHFEPVATFASTTASAWVIKGVLPQAGLAVVYGASGSGKSFAVLDMALAIAQGRPWRGRKVRQGKVAYIAAEGADGFRKRLAAYALHQGIELDDVPMTVLNGAPNLLEVKDAADIVVGVKAAGGANVIIIDTLAQTMPGGNENAGEDMGKALAHCKRIHEATGALVILIHHSGKDQAKGARGWSGLRAAADAEIEVMRDEPSGQRSLRLSKNKDGEDGLQWAFELQIVQLGVDEDLDPITSCVVIESELKVQVQSKAMGPVESVVHAVVMEMAEFQSAGIEVEAVVSESMRRLPGVEEGKRDTRRQRVRRAISTLTTGDSAPFWVENECISVC